MTPSDTGLWTAGGGSGMGFTSVGGEVLAVNPSEFVSRRSTVAADTHRRRISVGGTYRIWNVRAGFECVRRHRCCVGHDLRILDTDPYSLADSESRMPSATGDPAMKHAAVQAVHRPSQRARATQKLLFRAVPKPKSAA